MISIAQCTNSVCKTGSTFGIKLALLLALTLALALPAQAQTTTQQRLPPSVANALKRAAIPLDAVATYVQEVNADRPLITVNDTAPMNPASTMKLVTSAAALDLLGPVYTWKTQAFANGAVAGGVLDGDLIVKGGGDPKLVMENFWLFLRQIRAQGVREIRGNVVLDRSMFAAAVSDPARFDGDPAKPYNVGPDALLLGYKAITLRFKPEPASGTALVSADTPLEGVRLVAPALSGEECGAWQNKLQLVVSAAEIRFNGKLPASCGEKSWSIHPYGMTPTQYFGAVFRQMWRELGGSLQGKVIDGALSATATLLAEHESVALPEVLRDMNKYSNNVIARQVLLTIGTEVEHAPGTPALGAHVVKTWLAAKGIENPDLVIENGAGLSRIARISAGTLGRMLVAAFRSPTMPELMSSLPIAGVDGTMRRRLPGRSVVGNAHIKTGSLEQVRAMAGYVLAASGRRYAVVNLINHANAGAGREAQDLLLQWIYDNG